MSKAAHKQLRKGPAPPSPARGGARAASRAPPPYGISLADRPGPVQLRARSPEHRDPLERQADRIAAAVAGEGSLPRLLQAVGDRTGAPLEPVRFHHDQAAARRAGELDALAFTTGNDVYFGRGQFDPHSRGGREIIAHELVHVAQQRAGAPRVQKLEAPKHQAAEMVGLTGAPGFSGEEAFDTYFGNWMRDLNQVFVPMIMEMAGGSADFPAALVSYLGAKKFGREFQLEDFGYYIPAEHIDSPAGLVKKYDLLPEQPQVSDPALRPPVPAHPRGKLDTLQEEVAPGTKVLGADIFSVDETGMIAFLSRTLVHVENRLRLSVMEGRTRPGLMHLGAALHAVEDLFAHSNWIEIAVSKLLADDPGLLPELKGKERSVYTFAPEVSLPRKGGRPERRPVLMTGSFTSLDTAMSIASELVNILRAPYEPPSTEEELRAEEKMTYVGLKTFHQRVAQSPVLQDKLAAPLVQHVPFMNEKRARALVKQDPAEAYRIVTSLTHVLPWKAQVELAKQTHAFMDAAVFHPLADKLEAAGLEANVADTSLLRNRREAARLSQGGFSTFEEEKMKAIEAGGDELGRKQSVAEQKKAIIEEQTLRLAHLKATPAYVVAGPSHSMIAKDHSNSPFFGLAFKVARLAVEKIGSKVVDAWVEAHGQKAREATSPEPTQHPDPKVQAEKEALARLRKKGWTESTEFGQKVLEHGGDPEQSYDLAGQREASAKNVERAAAVLRAIAVSPDKVGGALKALGGGLEKLNPLWVKKVGQSLAGAGAAVQQEGGAAVQVADLQKLAADLEADARMIRAARTGEAREAANDKLVGDRARTLQALVAHPEVAPATRALVLIALDQEIRHTAVAYRTVQVKALAAAPAPVVEHVAMRALGPERAAAPALVALLETTRQVFSHPYQGSWWHPAVLEYIQKHRAILLASIEARNARYAVFPGGGH